MPKPAPNKYAYQLNKQPTDTIQRFIDWVEKEIGYEMDPMTAQLSSALRISFQKSEDNQSHLRQRREDLANNKVQAKANRENAKSAREDLKAKRAAKAEAKAAKPAAKAQKPPAPEKAPAEDSTASPAPKKASPKKAAEPAKRVPKKKAAAALAEEF